MKTIIALAVLLGIAYSTTYSCSWYSDSACTSAVTTAPSVSGFDPTAISTSCNTVTVSASSHIYWMFDDFWTTTTTILIDIYGSAGCAISTTATIPATEEITVGAECQVATLTGSAQSSSTSGFGGSGTGYVKVSYSTSTLKVTTAVFKDTTCATSFDSMTTTEAAAIATTTTTGADLSCVVNTVNGDDYSVQIVNLIPSELYLLQKSGTATTATAWLFKNSYCADSTIKIVVTGACSTTPLTLAGASIYYNCQSAASPAASGIQYLYATLALFVALLALLF